jgi:hypothetical protein
MTPESSTTASETTNSNCRNQRYFWSASQALCSNSWYCGCEMRTSIGLIAASFCWLSMFPPFSEGHGGYGVPHPGSTREQRKSKRATLRRKVSSEKYQVDSPDCVVGESPSSSIWVGTFGLRKLRGYSGLSNGYATSATSYEGR